MESLNHHHEDDEELWLQDQQISIHIALQNIIKRITLIAFLTTLSFHDTLKKEVMALA